MGFFSLISTAFAIYSAETTKNYRQLRTDEVSGIVAFESERVGKIIAEMERNAVDLALAGRQFFLSKERSAEQAVSLSVENFRSFRASVGGGIWFEPYALDLNEQRVCYYAFFDPALGEVRHSPEFISEEYDYHNQMWYKTIITGLGREYEAVWTPPYYDDVGIFGLMTTVGSGIYDSEGRLVGIATVDWEIQSMVDRLSSIKPTSGSFVLLASPKDDYIISGTLEGRSVLAGASLRNLSWFKDLRLTDGDTVGLGYITEGGTEYISFSRRFSNGWLFSVQIPVQEIFAEIETRNNQFIFIFASSFVSLLVLAAILLSRIINRPLRRLSAGVSELGSGNFDKNIEIRSKDELGDLASAFNKMMLDLKESIEQRTREQAEKERISAELNVAARLQASMLPCTFPAFPGRTEFDIYASMQPAKEVGGDFYDFFLIDDRTLAIVIADVSGKGVPAALFMVISKTLIRNTVLSGKQPEEVFQKVNKMLCENNEACMFVTAFLAYLDLPSGKLTFVNAGHNPPLRRVKDQFVWLKTKPNFVLAGREDTVYKQHEIILKQDDELFLYTDGITDSMNNKGALFGNSLLLKTANKGLDLPLNEFTLLIKQEIEKFSEGAEQADDITMLALRYNGLGLTIKAKLENEDTIQDFVNARIRDYPIKIQNQMKIIVDEIFSNISRYAYSSKSGAVTVRTSANSNFITLVFEDSGIPFNPLSAESPDITLSAEERELGGLGLFLVKKLTDSMVYKREGNKNILTVKKSLGKLL